MFNYGEQVALEVDELGLTVDEGVRLLKERDDSDSHGASFCRVARILDLRPAYRTRPATEPETGMTDHDPGTITLEMMRANLYTAVFSDVLDELGYREQSPRVDLPPWSGPGVLVGRAKTTLWATLDREEERPYELELRAVDECRPDDVFIAAAGGTMVSGVWGELLSTAASSRGCAGAIIDGGVRDVRKIRELGFPVFARGTCVRDSKGRQTVVDLDTSVELGGVRFAPGDLVIADLDGVVVVPGAVEDRAVRAAWAKAREESRVRDAIRGGMGAAEAYRRFGVL